MITGSFLKSRESREKHWALAITREHSETMNFVGKQSGNVPLHRIGLSGANTTFAKAGRGGALLASPRIEFLLGAARGRLGSK